MTLDLDKVRTKLQYIRDTVRRLEDIRSQGREAFLADPIVQSASERYLQIGIEAILDLAGHIIAREGLAVATTYRGAVETLLREGILPASHKEIFLRMVSFRNRLVHLYDRIDTGQIFTILEEHLGDFETFIQAITQRYFSSDKRETP